MDSIAPLRIENGDRPWGRGSAGLLSRRRFIGAGLAGAFVVTASLGRQPLAEETQLKAHTAASKDGTGIAFDRTGKGPALILIGGALSERSTWGPYAKLLAPNFTVLSYDRRGRGDSGDTAPYAVEREIEDLEALLDEVGGKAFVHGQSSGAVLAMAAAAKLPDKIEKLSLYEPPFIIDGSRPLPPENFAEHLDELIAANRRGEAVEYFLTEVVGMPAEALAEMKGSPMWPGLEAMAHTLAYDVDILGDNLSGKPLPADKLSAVTAPTLVIAGGASPEWIRNTAKALAEVLPDAEYRTLDGQAHNAAPDVLIPEIESFLIG